jgi:hypothetical protein
MAGINQSTGLNPATKAELSCAQKPGFCCAKDLQVLAHERCAFIAARADFLLITHHFPKRL